jgi:hypothetical protein
MRFFRRVNAHVQEYAALYPSEKLVPAKAGITFSLAV